MKTIADISKMCRDLAEELNDPVLYYGYVEFGMRANPIDVLYDIIEAQARNNANLRKMVHEYAMKSAHPIMFLKDKDGNSLCEPKGQGARGSADGPDA